MIYGDRDPAFWTRIASDPQVRSTLYGQSPELVGELMQRSDVRHFASEHGGWAFIRLDPYGLLWDTHAMFTPDGWGREAHSTMKHAFRTMFQTAHALFVTETGNRRSKPPLSCGFKACGGTLETAIGPLTTWVLTRAAWASSPAYRRA